MNADVDAIQWEIVRNQINFGMKKVVAVYAFLRMRLAAHMSIGTARLVAANVPHKNVKK